MTTGETVHDSPKSLSPSARAGLEHILVACADTKLLLGYHYAECTFDPPELEADVATSLAQSERGHVRMLQTLLEKHYGHNPDELVLRDPAAFATIGFVNNAIRNWADFVAMTFVVDMAVTRVIHSMSGSSFEPVRTNVERMLEEEQYHADHGKGWFCSLARHSAETRAEIERATTEALESAALWFGPPDDDEDVQLIANGCKSESNSKLFTRLFADVQETARACGAAVDAPELSFDGWDPATRRRGGPGPNEQILNHLRGDKNTVFKVK